MKKTKFFNAEKRNWVLIDAKDKVLGRLSTRIAKILQGKNKPTYSPNFLCGDKVVVVNVKYLRFTGKKLDEKVYDKYTRYHNGRKEITLKRLAEKNPSKILYLAVKGMLPRNKLGAQMLKSLKIYPQGEYSQTAQNPQKLEV
ncbi:MAG: 50S ribosomal protein L13 [Candidatus Omnitrophota bacterium]|nr:MAG: 50S ribosomal protein L13 [Candidatus Omnitrophota bacterium]